MRIGHCSWIVFLVISFVFTSCATTTRVEKLGSESSAKGEDCEIQFFKDKRPQKRHETVGKIESHIKKNFFFGGKVQLEDEAFKELRIKACGLGGDAVFIEDCIETSVAEMSHIHVWATVIKYLK